MDQIRAIVKDILLSLLKAVKILLVYILPSILLALITSEEGKDLILGIPELSAHAGIINIVLIAIANVVKDRAKVDSKIREIL